MINEQSYINEVDWGEFNEIVFQQNYFEVKFPILNESFNFKSNFKIDVWWYVNLTAKYDAGSWSYTSALEDNDKNRKELFFNLQ